MSHALTYTVNGTPYTRKEALRLIWKHTHPDFRGKRLDGVRTILALDEIGGTCLMELSALTDAQVADKLPFAVRREALI